jgi:hypothetical protein
VGGGCRAVLDLRYNQQASDRIDELARWVRVNKLAHQAHGLRNMVPWVTTGYDGVFTTSHTYSQAVHMLAGGCTGFAVFATAGDGDWDTWGSVKSLAKTHDRGSEGS